MFTLKVLGGLSLEDAAGVMTGRAAQKRRLALLALLSTAPGRVLSRDRLIGHLWPESETEQARHLLSVALYELRKALGEEVLVSRGDDVALEGERFGSDAQAFEAALERGEVERAVELYTGPFLDGFYLSEAAEFERWAEAERDRLARLHHGALEAVAEQRAAAGDPRGAVEGWRRLAALDPYNSRTAMALVRALAAAGDRAGALQHVRVHEVLLREEFGAEPDPELVALATRLREEPDAVPAPPPAGPQSPVVGLPSPHPGEEGAAVKQSAEQHDEQPLPVSVPEQNAPEAMAAERTTDKRRPMARRRRRWRSRPGLPVSVSALALLSVLWVGVSQGWIPLREGRAPSSVAVLPLVELGSAGENEYLSDGLTEEIINALAKVEGVRVAARTSAFAFKGKNADIREIGEQLNVGSVVEGTLQRDGSRIRVTIRLVDVRNGYQLWSQSYDREVVGALEVQEDIARSVVGALKGELVGEDTVALAAAAIPHPEAFDLYLRGRWHWYQRTGEGFGQALSHFQRAVARDPGYALAHVGLADVYTLLGSSVYGVLPPREALPRAKAALSRALELDPNSAEAHAALGNVHLNYDWDFQAAERHFQRAMQLNPGYATAHHWSALNLLAMGRPREALARVRHGRELEPLSLVTSTGLARVLYFTRQFPAAIAEYRRALEMDSTFVTAHLGLGLAYIQTGAPERALAEYQTALRLLGGPQPIVLALMAHAQASMGRAAEARAILAALEAEAERRYIPAEYLALVHLGLGDRERALAGLEQAHANRSDFMAHLPVEPLLDPLRSEPRFAELVRRVGLSSSPRK